MTKLHRLRQLSSLLTETGYCSVESAQKWLENASRNGNVSGSVTALLADSDNISNIKDSLTALHACGFDDSRLLRLLGSSNGLRALSTNPSLIREAFDCLSRLGFSLEERTRLVSSCPDIFQTNMQQISESYWWMRQTFTDRQARQLVLLRPVVLAVDKEALIERANYLFARMRVLGREVAFSGAISHHIDRIRCRHIFLLRSGRYEFPDAKARVHRLGKNPSLRDILDTSDLEFVKKVARLTLPEYLIFQKVLKEEGDE